MKKQFSIRKQSMLIAALCLSCIFAFSQPVNWSTVYNAGDNSTTTDLTVAAKSIAYNPANNNVYAYGNKYFHLPASPGPAYTREMGIIELNSSGMVINETFDHHYDSLTQMTGHLDDAAEMVINSNGSIYVTGKFFFSDTKHYDMVVIKYSKTLVFQWRHYFWSVGSADDAGTAIALDSQENVIVAGQLTDDGSGTGKNIFIAKLDPAGGVIWSNPFTTAGVADDFPVDITVGSSNNIYVAGTSTSATNGNQIELFKINSFTGDQIWEKSYNTVPNTLNDDNASSMALDANSGNIYITGSSQNASGNYDIVTLKYNASGTLKWVRSINNPGTSDDFGKKVVLDASGNIYTGGRVDRDAGPNQDHELIVRKYDAAGSTLLTKKFNGTLAHCTFGDLAVAPSGSFYITGAGDETTNPPTGAIDLATVKYAAGGALLWSDVYFWPGTACASNAEGYKIAINSSTSDMTVGGRVSGFCPGSHPREWLVRNYHPTLREEGIFQDNNSQDNLNVTVSPNPAADYFSVAAAQRIDQVKVMDVTGKIISDFKPLAKKFEINTSPWAKGVYSMLIYSGKTPVVKKIVKQ